MSQARSNGPISLLLICHSYPPVLGGSELEAQRVCAALMQRGHHVKVVCAGGPPMPPLQDWVDPEGIPVRIYAGGWNGSLKDIVFALRVAGMLFWERRNYKLVYFLMQGLHLAAGLPVARILGKPIFMKIGGSGVIPLMTQSRAGRIELRWLRKWAYRVMILNDGMHAEGIKEGFPATQLYWMPNPVDTDQFSPCTGEQRLNLRAQFGISPHTPVVLYCGRLAPEKALSSLLKAFAQVVCQIPEALLVLVGDGPLRGALAEEAQQLSIPPERIRFIGRVEPKQVCSWLQVADVFTLVSFSEGFACALVEAMSVGLPSVVSDIPANRQLIESGKHGLLAPVEDCYAISAAIIRLLENSELRLSLGTTARRRVIENYSTSKIADRYETLFREVGSDA
jgi:glycosyltransferase involved in cell wall biosynthesis